MRTHIFFAENFRDFRGNYALDETTILKLILSKEGIIFRTLKTNSNCSVGLQDKTVAFSEHNNIG
jgi:hypothetical protein